MFVRFLGFFSSTLRTHVSLRTLPTINAFEYQLILYIYIHIRLYHQRAMTITPDKTISSSTYILYTHYSVIIYYNIALCLYSSFLFDFDLSSSSIGFFLRGFAFRCNYKYRYIISSLRVYIIYRSRTMSYNTLNIHTYNKDRPKFTKLYLLSCIA